MNIVNTPRVQQLLNQLTTIDSLLAQSDLTMLSNAAMMANSLEYQPLITLLTNTATTIRTGLSTRKTAIQTELTSL